MELGLTMSHEVQIHRVWYQDAANSIKERTYSYFTSTRVFPKYTQMCLTLPHTVWSEQQYCDITRLFLALKPPPPPSITPTRPLHRHAPNCKRGRFPYLFLIINTTLNSVDPCTMITKKLCKYLDREGSRIKRAFLKVKMKSISMSKYTPERVGEPSKCNIPLCESWACPRAPVWIMGVSEGPCVNHGRVRGPLCESWACPRAQLEQV